MPTGKPRFCWDSCVFISLLIGTDRTPDELRNLYAVEAILDKGEAYMFTSSVSITEIFECKLTPDQRTKLQRLLNQQNSRPVWFDSRIAQIAREIREYYFNQPKLVDIPAPDAIHLATAIYFEADVLHTYDGCGARKRPSDLLRLKSPIAGKYPLEISIPKPYKRKSDEEETLFSRIENVEGE